MKYDELLQSEEFKEVVLKLAISQGVSTGVIDKIIQRSVAPDAATVSAEIVSQLDAIEKKPTIHWPKFNAPLS
jgi:hypothetical protein